VWGQLRRNELRRGGGDWERSWACERAGVCGSEEKKRRGRRRRDAKMTRRGSSSSKRRWGASRWAACTGSGGAFAGGRRGLRLCLASRRAALTLNALRCSRRHIAPRCSAPLWAAAVGAALMPHDACRLRSVLSLAGCVDCAQRARKVHHVALRCRHPAPAVRYGSRAAAASDPLLVSVSPCARSSSSRVRTQFSGCPRPRMSSEQAHAADLRS
jgi:hypothetical protein